MFGETSDILKHNSNSILVSEDIDDIIRNIEILIRDDHKRNLLGNRAKKDISNKFLTWNERFDKEIKILKRLVRINENKLKVFFVFPSFPNKAESYRIDQILALKKENHEIICLSIKKPYSKNIDQQNRHLFNETIYLNEHSPLITKTLQFIKRLAFLLFRDINLFKKILSISIYQKNISFGRLIFLSYCFEHKPDIIHAHFGHVGTYISSIKSMIKIPLLVSFYGWDYGHDLEHRVEEYNKMFNLADGITAMNDFMKARLIKFGCPKEKIRIVRIWVDTNLPLSYKTHFSTDKNIKILSIGRLTHKKGYETCLKLMHHLKLEGVSFSYTILGEGPLEQSPKNLSNKYKLNKYLNFAGVVKRYEVGKYLNDCDIFLLHSVKGPNGDLEGTPTVLLEAGLLKKPVLSTYHAGIPEIIEHGKSGYLTKENDIKEAKKLLIKLIKEPKKQIEFGEQLFVNIQKKYTQNINSKKFLKFYNYLQSKSFD